MRIVHPQAGKIEFATLREAIALGKRAGWASGAKPTKLTDGTKHYEFRQSDLLYTDDFIGEQGFVGREMVRHIPSNVPIWGMNYSDMFLAPTTYTPERAMVLKDEVFGFLKEMLLQGPRGAPFRGPVTSLRQKAGSEGRVMEYYNLFESRFNDINTYCNEDIIREFEGTESIGILDVSLKKKFTPFVLKYQGRILVADAYVKD